jgi:MFS family permease
LFFPVWGRIADRFNNKSVLNLAVPMYFLLFLLWPLMTVPRPEFALLFVVVFHLLGGIATAGVTLSANNLVLMSTPRGRSTPHLAFNSLAQGLAASLAPILAGCAADVFERHAVIFSIQWHYTDPLMPLDVAFPALQLHGLDFVFLLAFVFGLYAVHRLLAVRERGEVPKSIVRREFFLELERMAHRLSIAPGVRVLTELVSSPNPEHRGGTGPDE